MVLMRMETIINRGRSPGASGQRVRGLLDPRTSVKETTTRPRPIPCHHESEVPMKSAVWSLIAMFVVSSAALAENWPQWRGAKLDGISHEKDIPTKWSSSENVAWKLP